MFNMGSVAMNIVCTLTFPMKTNLLWLLILFRWCWKKILHYMRRNNISLQIVYSQADLKMTNNSKIHFLVSTYMKDTWPLNLNYLSCFKRSYEIEWSIDIESSSSKSARGTFCWMVQQLKTFSGKLSIPWWGRFNRINYICFEIH